MMHDRKCTIKPNQILQQITELLRQASELMEQLHEEYDDIKTIHVQTGCGDTWAEVKKRSTKTGIRGRTEKVSNLSNY